ncbi:DUF6152 family protein [Sphingobium nicotianae]|uniref:Copper-binding protein n=1 Tax=Sphingobium nicotianae TaxID=2782607 RepID=A0A9X1DA23_9SPHN|nr:DUF6152 family protein [Sphingobium nicotianae]MBT2186143.1 hypothetical protein [Sphingobium nicotianae]
MRIKSVAMLAVAALAVPAIAHHSFAMFDMKKDVTAEGVVTDFRWTNPHAWMHVDMADKSGTRANWALEMTSPNNLVLSGWRRSSLKPGDKVTVTYHPLLNGKTGGSLVKVVLPDSKILENK